MNTILSWDKPKKKMTTKKWKEISADGAPAGVYTPNMSSEDMKKWKAKHIKGQDERVEIRKSFHFMNGKKYPLGICYAAQMVIVVRKYHGNEPQVLISTNGKLGMTLDETFDMNEAIKEAIEILL